MTLTEKQIQDLEEAVLPLQKWLRENTHPHVSVIVDSHSAEAVESLARTLLRD